MCTWTVGCEYWRESPGSFYFHSIFIIMQRTVQMHMKELEPKRRAPKSTKYRNSLDRQTFVCIEVLFQLAVFFLSMQEIVSSHIFLAVFFHSIYVSKQFCLITCSGMVIPPKVLLFLANQILYSKLSLCLYGSVLSLEMTMGQCSAWRWQCSIRTNLWDRWQL